MTEGNRSTLYSRHEHGAHPVTVIERAGSIVYEVRWPEQGNVEYPSARQLIKALYNGGRLGPEARDPGMSFDRYFRVGRFADPDVLPPPGQSVLSFLGARDLYPTVDLPVQEPKPRLHVPRARRVQPARALDLTLIELLDLPPRQRRAKRRLAAGRRPERRDMTITPDGRMLGIDLASRGHEVRKLLFAGFGARIARSGYDPEDVLQEVYRGILARNVGKCPWDGKKSSFGHYVHMVCECILNNYHRKQSRRGEMEQVGLPGLGGDGDWEYLDAAEVASDLNMDTGHRYVSDSEFLTDPSEPVSMDYALESLEAFLATHERPEAQLAAQILPLVYKGYQRGEIAKKIGVEPSKIGRALSFLRKGAEAWAEEQGF